MIRFSGAVLIIAAATYAGFLLAAAYRNRPKEIRQWRSALQAIETEILYGQVPVTDLALHLSRQLPRPAALFFENLYKMLNTEGMPLRHAWAQVTEDFWQDTSMKQSEKQIILQFGKTLGTEDTVNQQKHIHLAMAHLKREEDEALAGQKANERMMRSLGLLTGILIVLILY
jgi:stage III sporulation protein AB